MILGTISAVDDDNGLQLTIDGEDSPTTKKYSYMASYVPAANDRVLIEEIGGSYVIVGKIITDKDMSGIAREAATAGTAETATTAETADGLSTTNYASTNGYVVYSYSRQYSSAIGGYYVSDITFTDNTRQNYVYHK